MSNTVARAFELAFSGECATMDDIRQRLRRENLGQVDQHLAGPLIRGQLRKIMAERPRTSAQHVSAQRSPAR